MRRAFAIAAVLGALPRAASADLDGATIDGRWGLELRNDPGERMIALRLGVGGLPLAGDHRWSFYDGLQLGWAIGAGFRVDGEFDLVWLEENAPVAMDQHGFGARAELAARHALATWKVFYADVEAGGGGVAYADTVAGRQLVPEGFVGLRAGYDFASAESRDRILEAALDVRFVATPAGTDWMFGVSFGWGR